MKGYDYFKDEKSVEYTGNVHATFSAQLSGGPRRNMGLWMIGQNNRRVFAVNAPADHAGRPWLPKDLLDAPMPTLLVRQSGDAWARPFITVFEPYLSSDDATIRSARSARVEGGDVEVAACFVEGQLTNQTPHDWKRADIRHGQFQFIDQRIGRSHRGRLALLGLVACEDWPHVPIAGYRQRE